MKFRFQEVVFPLSWKKGASQQGIQRQRMQQMAQQSKPMGLVEFEKRMVEHQQFLREGGAGGTWQALQVDGLVISIYQIETKSEAKQFSLEYGRLTNDIRWTGLVLPFINCCAAYLPELEAQRATLPHCLFTDCFLENAQFEQADLQGTDFSRACLKNANFRLANLSQVDFENCDLRGADFRGAKIAGAKFPGANLEGVLV